MGPHTWNKLKTQLNIKTSTGFGPLVNSSVSPVNDPVISSEFSNQRKQPVTGNLVAHYGIDIVDSVRSKTLGKPLFQQLMVKYLPLNTNQMEMVQVIEYI
ncbi:MAG: hypothetical protein IPO98_19105 [Saprospiraceae bacterium]|nr:hypothetical protein [Saprospiraceae bacterium]